MAHSQPNLILSRLTQMDFRIIEADLVDVDLPVRKILERSHRRIHSVYFPDSGFASVVADGAGTRPIEVGIIGREGMNGSGCSARQRPSEERDLHPSRRQRTKAQSQRVA